MLMCKHDLKKCITLIDFSMIGDYSSYLEFIGAVYFTMSLDDILKRKVWSPQDEVRLKKAIDGFDINNDPSLKKAIVHANRAKGDELQAELSKKSVFGLFSVGALLLVCGYEPCIADDPLKLSVLHLTVLYVSIALIASLFLGLMWFAFKKWKYTSTLLVLTFIAFFVIYYFRLVYGESEIETLCLKYTGLIVSTIITIPILWQLFISWMYKSIFYGYIKSKIKDANEKYKQVTGHINDGNLNDVPEAYKKIIMNQTLSHKNGTTKELLDDSLTEYKGVLYAEIKKIGENVKLYKLAASWVIHHIMRCIKWLKLPIARKFSYIRASSTIDVDDLQTHAQKFRLMQSQGKITLRGYCEMAGIETKQFIQYLKNHK